MFDNDSTTYYHSGAAQSRQGGDWFGVDLGIVKDVWEVKILQGRNSVDDVDYLDHARLEYSVDGKTWNTLIDDMNKQYIINWKGEAVKARYIRVIKLPSEKGNWVGVRSFEVNPVNADQLGFKVEAEDAEAVLYAFDNHSGTSYKNSGVMSFGVPQGVKKFTYLAKYHSDNDYMCVEQLDANNNVLDRSVVYAPLFTQELKAGAVKVVLIGNVELFEIVPVK
jgi:hyaluronoglucosaminidase